jgi:hypothetical protein
MSEPANFSNESHSILRICIYIEFNGGVWGEGRGITNCKIFFPHMLLENIMVYKVASLKAEECLLE